MKRSNGSLKILHYWSFALALIALEAKDQAVQALEKANHLFRQEYGKDYQKALTKLQEVRSTPLPGERISFDVAASVPGTLSIGIVVKYDASRGFGFMKDDTVGKNGVQAAEVWLQ